jgi:hypothetical protein
MREVLGGRQRIIMDELPIFRHPDRHAVLRIERIAFA